MRQSSRAYRIRTGVALLGALITTSACGSHSNPARLDLAAELPRAERRAANPDAAIRAQTIGDGAEAVPAVVMTAPSRVIWSSKMPIRARLRTAVALLPNADGTYGPGVTARIGISDLRVYEPLFLLKLESPPVQTLEWHPVSINMSAYAGWQWSLFYRPTDTVWRLVFNADPTPGGTIAWSRPVVE